MRLQGDVMAPHLADGLDPASVHAYAQFAIRTRSPHARATLRAAGETAALGRVTALSGEADAHRRGLELLDEAVAGSGVASLPGDVLTVWAGLLLRAGRDTELRAVLDDPDVALPDADRWMLRTDLANPHRVPPDTRAGSSEQDLRAAEEEWLRTFNEVHSPDGLEPIRLRPPEPGDHPYQRLATPVPVRVDGDLVTVVMSAYNPDRDLLLAVRGVLEQTWHNLELLIVDDASATGTDLLEEAGAMDPRVRVVRAPRNSGTYEARNLALSIARGRWVTFQDSDDWTHPRRIEHQVRHLQESPEVLGNRTWTLRAYPDLTMTFVGYPATRVNASSLLFDRTRVAQLVGDFDSTRKTGDVELPLRLRSVRPGSVRDLLHPAPLAITQLRSGSLSRDDALPGWMRWDRLAYRDSYLEWHRQLASKRLDPVLTASGDRPYPLPRPSWYPDPSEAPELASWDVVVLGDVRPAAPGALRALGVARTAAQAGLRTAVAHAETPRPLTAKRVGLLPGLSTDVRLGRLGVTNAHEDDEADLLVVTEPACLLHLDAVDLRVRTVLALSHEADPEDWSVPAVEERCRRLLGTTPLWGGPASVHGRGDERSAVRHAVPDDRWCGSDLAPVAGHGWLDVGASGMTDRTHRHEPPDTPAKRAMVVGHHLEDSSRRWPRRASAVRAAFPEQIILPGADGPDAPVPIEVHCLRGVRTATRVLKRRLPSPSWFAFTGTSMTEREYLSHIDVWAYFGEWDDAAEFAALEALGAGLPCLLGEDAATSGLRGPVRCVTPEDAREALEDLLADDSAPVHSAASRQAEWTHTLHRLMADEHQPA